LCRRLAIALHALLLAGGLSPSFAAEPGQLVLVVQPVLSEEKTRQAFQPLADYLEQVTDRKCVLRTLPNSLAYWDMVRQPGGYDLVLDEAHFTDYRVQKLGFEILAKIPDTVSYSLIVPEGSLVLDPTELVGKTVATLGPPSIGAARLNGMFPNPMRQPSIIEVNSVEEGMELVVKRRVHAAILPTPLVSQQITGDGGIVVVTTTEPVPHYALSAAPGVDAGLREKIRTALLTADKTEEGKKMLQGIDFPKFDPASAGLYANQSNILKEYWGY
jgi:hypothetical protein